MASDMHIDPVKVKEFATKLKALSGFTNEQMSMLHSRLDQLNRTWRDDQFGEFREEVKKTGLSLELFTNEVSKVVPQLHRDAERAEEYRIARPPKG